MKKNGKYIAIRKSDTDEIRVTPYEFKGKKYMDLRIFFRHEDEGAMYPTKKGVTIERGLIKSLQNALAKALELDVIDEVVM